MSLFEFVTVMVSMILALTLGQLLSGVSLLIKSTRDVRWHLPHTLWLVALGQTLVNHWWALWDFHDLDWNYISFIYILIAPVLIALAVGVIVPDRTQPVQLDMEQQFHRVRRPFAGLFSVYVLAMWFDGPLLAGQDPFGAIGLLHIPILVGTLLALQGRSGIASLIAPMLFITPLAMVMAVRFQAAAV